VTVLGGLRDCRVTSEDPPGYGFGDAALSMATTFRMTPGRRAGRPVESEVRFPIRFRYPEDRPSVPPPTEQAIRLATELLELFVANDGWDRMVWRSAHPLLYPDDPRAALAPPERITVMRVARALGERYRPRYMREAAVQVAERMTIEEMQAAITFLRSPAGRTFSVSVMPAMGAGSAAMDRLWQDFARDFRTEYCNRELASRMCRGQRESAQSASDGPTPPTPAPAPPGPATPGPRP
jgi:protein TonB